LLLRAELRLRLRFELRRWLRPAGQPLRHVPQQGLWLRLRSQLLLRAELLLPTELLLQRRLQRL
jgi:hypothetical protein